MPRVARELKPVEIRALKSHHENRPTRHAVGGVAGLHLQVTPSGARSWLLLTTVAGKRREIGLGGYPETSPGAARERAREAKELIRNGKDPVAERREAKRIFVQGLLFEKTFTQAMEDYLSARLTEFRNEKHRKQWRSTLDTYAVPLIGGMAVKEITVHDIIRVLEPIWSTKTETASRLRGRIEAILAWSTVHGHREGDNPAKWKGNLDAILPKPGKVSKAKHWPALSMADAPAWFADLRARSGSATRALEFLTITAARSGEVRGATWDEIDLEAALWTIPSERMKAGNEHRVPLTKEAVDLLKRLPRAEDSDFVFPATRGGQLSDMALSACMRRINEKREGGYLDPRTKRPAVPHGLRSTFRDWVAEKTEYPREMAEIALAHNVGSEVERAYLRGDMIEKRRKMMADWQGFLRHTPQNKHLRADHIIEIK
ncbi:tyrosine-type recombinase/integrase [Sulfitobacter dubius]|uniref:tyrosine-type recombinase/integrase n=1 Tax=Sulfitobacter dubius TaxID=218673 RepID=UPI002942B258|nr:integrase arm-type DNA-binding domain-containing protein [Sulfitobacter dubius]WOI29359.1 tyrosine-type recombinase/integrase [Sulfitobacter dubius]